MLLVLVYLAALSPLAAAVDFGTTAELDFSDCPVAHYGQVYTTVYVSKTKLDGGEQLHVFVRADVWCPSLVEGEVI
ncbi:hypothetical protein F2P81_025691 [Scophthalmus maximus]|uniref:Uncharacterized protein n=1 Tax=Scophthalmus maximus TaxID=52904 RepID=A0A6A4RHV1_SCOMX|nr:hypothetical protein F2P81_025691 [Scophthalmus maximus]